MDGGDCWAIIGMNEWQEEQRYLKKICPSAALSTTDPTWLDLGLNSSYHGGKPMTNLLSYSTASTPIKLTQYICLPVPVHAKLETHCMGFHEIQYMTIL
jgi:hypothetical protein